MIIWGISALSHDASIAVVKNNDILFAGHSERYSKIKNDKFLNFGIIDDALQFGKPDKIVWFEKQFPKKLRQFFSGEWKQLKKVSPENHLNYFSIDAPIEYVEHHASHAAGGFFTSGFDDASILVVDAIGEWDTTTIWNANNNNLTKVFSQKYPNSLGLFYSAITQYVGLKPNEEEFILMGMAAYGTPRFVDQMKKDLITLNEFPNFSTKRNLHLGCLDWLKGQINSEQDKFDLAASAQHIIEEYFVETATWISNNLPSKNLILSGGCALNCLANTKIVELGIFENIWIMPNPGDAGSSLGAIAASLRQPLKWESPYLGHEIDRPLNIDSAVECLLHHGIIGVANGKAEFGPRALGNRSIFADTRRIDIKDRVNDLKHRQRFRPFAPIILEEFANDFFEMPVETSPFMQFTAKCKFPNKFPGICHIDATSRVQTINRKQNERIYDLILSFYHRTGCPMLLNTSLNIRGEPLVNNWQDALLFSNRYDITVF